MITSMTEIRFVGRLAVGLGKLLSGQNNAPMFIDKWARIHPDRPAIYHGDRVMTYREQQELMNRVANHFQTLGGKPGDVVAVIMENCPEYLTLIAGLNKIGMVASLINTNLRQKVLAHALTVCTPRWIVAGQSLIPAVEEALPDLALGKDTIWVWDGAAPEGYEKRDLGEVLKAVSSGPVDTTHKSQTTGHILNIYTSGTTGMPKAAKISNLRFCLGGHGMGWAMARYSYHDCVYAPVPLYHSLGITAAWGGALANGGAIGLRRRFSASKFWDDAIKYNATAAVMIGEMPRYLLAQTPKPQEKAHKITRVTCAGMRENIWNEFQERFAIDKIFEFYGGTETNVACLNLEGRPGMLGRLWPLMAAVAKWDADTETLYRNEQGRCVRVQPGEEGMLIGKLSSLLKTFDGYLSEKDNQAKMATDVFKPGDTWFVTGDVVKVHKGRWVSFVDRAGDTYRWKAENVATKEVEMILDGCPGMTEVNVYGVQVPGEDGAAGMAAVVRDGEWNGQSISEYVSENLPPYAIPLFIRVCAELPKTATLKHIKYVLKKDGFDPSKIEDPLYIWDRHTKQYKILDEDLYADVIGGNVKL
jgi:acyl-CoA synthetase (AMP-forming)/AMP-acid ligase II